MANNVGILVVLAVVGLAASASLAQEPAPAGTAGETSDSSAQSIPPIGDLLRLAEKASAPALGSDRGGAGDWSAPVKLAIVFAILALLPGMLVMMTSFTRIVIVLSFIRRAMTTQAIPPNIAIIGLALFLAIFTMSPTLAKINEQGIQPYLADQLTFAQALEEGNELLKEFMLAQTRQNDLELFVKLAGMEAPATAVEVPTHVAIPAFAVSEFRTAFEMGFLIFVPFLLVDLVTAAILLSAGMMMLPPIIISLPFKIILFVLVDGWRLLAESLVNSFY
jgi:flagellar biosynthetic protein FliP